MGLHEIRPPRGAKRERRRRGQGDSAGQGSYSGRGFKGQKKRESIKPHFEGGQLKLVKRLPYMRGFHNPFRIEYIGINLERLAAFGEGGEVSPDERGVDQVLRQVRDRQRRRRADEADDQDEDEASPVRQEVGERSSIHVSARPGAGE